MSNYCYRHGQAWIASRQTSGAPDTFSFMPLPEVDTLSISFSSEKITHVSKQASIASKDVSAVRMLDGTGSITLSEHSFDILKGAFYGTKGTIAGGSVAATAFEKAVVVVGDIIPIPGEHVGASSIVLTDSTGSPVTLTLNTHYEIVSAAAGLIKILSLATLTQPLKAAYTHAAGTSVSFLSQRVFELSLRFTGVNILNNDQVENIMLYKIQLDPTSEYNVMGDGTEVNKVTLAFDILKDTTKSTSATWGQYGWVKQVT